MRRFLTLPILLTAALPAAGQSQQWRMIDEGSRCPGCSVEMQLLARLGTEEGDGFVSAPAGIAQWNGMLAVTHWAKQGSISLYSSDGAFIRDVGRSGEGPGEFRFAGRLLVDHDTLFVLDHSLSRVTALTNEATVGRTASFPTGGVMSWIRLRDGRFVISADIRLRETVGKPLHLLSANGERLLSFGADTPSVLPDMPHRNQRLLALGPDGTIWSVRRTDYVLEQWAPDGRKLAELRRNASWFVPHGLGGFRTRNEPAHPTVEAFWIDDAGRAWLAIELPDTEWQDAVARLDDVQGRERWGYTDDNEYFDTVVEVVDLAQARVIAHGRMEPALTSARFSGAVATYREHDDGTQLIEVWRPRITQER
jgi:hypothetical protein